LIIQASLAPSSLGSFLASWELVSDLDDLATLSKNVQQTIKLYIIMKTTKVIIVASNKNKSNEALQILGQAMKLKFQPVCDQHDKVEIVTSNPSPADCKGAVIIGNMVPTYLGMKAELVLEVNAQGFMGVPDRFAEKLTVEEVVEMLNYPKAYIIEEVEVSEFIGEELPI